jgi:hypothetical protein
MKAYEDKPETIPPKEKPDVPPPTDFGGIKLNLDSPNENK